MREKRTVTMSESQTQYPPGETLEWTCHPVKRNPLVSLLVSLFLVAVIVIVYYITASRLFGILAALIMFASLAKFYFPTTYRMTPEGITIKTTTQTLHKPWSTYRSYYPDKNGVLLSPFLQPSRLENFRGLYVMFAGNREEVLSYIKAHLPTPEASPSENPSAEERQ